MAEIWDSITSYFKDKAASPLTGALLVSWFAWNHRVVFTLFSSTPIHERFAYIDEILYPTWVEIACYGVFLPILSATAYLLFYHKPALWIYGKVLDQRNALRVEKNRADGARLITIEERDRLNEKHAKQSERAALKLNQSESQVSSLEERVASLSKELQWSEQALNRLKASDVSLNPTSNNKNIALKSILFDTGWKLFFNPESGGNKTISFGAEGDIVEGRNDNEHTWKVSNGRLQIFNATGSLFSTFVYDVNKPSFVMLDGESKLANKGQFISPTDVDIERELTR